MYSFVGLCPFGNKFLFIQKKKKRWESVCLPKEEGGMGLRRVKDSNDASVMKHIWNLLYRNDF